MSSDQRITAILAEQQQLQEIVSLEKPVVFETLTVAGRNLLYLLSQGLTSNEAARVLSPDVMSWREIKSFRSDMPVRLGAQSVEQMVYMGLRHRIVEYKPRDPRRFSEATSLQEAILGLTALGHNEEATATLLDTTENKVARERQRLFNLLGVNNARSAIRGAFEIGYWSSVDKGQV